MFSKFLVVASLWAKRNALSNAFFLKGFQFFQLTLADKISYQVEEYPLTNSRNSNRNIMIH